MFSLGCPNNPLPGRTIFMLQFEMSGVENSLGPSQNLQTCCTIPETDFKTIYVFLNAEIYLYQTHRVCLNLNSKQGSVSRQSGCRMKLLTWALVSLRVSLRCGPPGVACALPRLGSLGVGRPVVVGACPRVCVPRRPGIITVAGLAVRGGGEAEWGHSGWEPERRVFISNNVLI